MSKRIEYIDNAKGILILSMIMGHIFLDGFVHDFIYTFHMPAFFIISGILFNYSSTLHKSLFQLLKSLFFTLVIPIVFFEVIGCIEYTAKYGANQNITGFIFNALTLNMNHRASWFLVTLLFGELMFFIMRQIAKNNHLFIGMSVTMLFIAIFIPNSTHTNKVIAQICLCIAFLTAGYYLASYFCKRNILIIIVSFVIVVFVAYINSPIGVSSMTINNPILFLLGCFSGTYFTLQISKIIQMEYLVYFGKNTLSILATHYFVFETLLKCFGIHDFQNVPVIPGAIVFLLTTYIEYLIISIFNKYVPFLVGKKRS